MVEILIFSIPEALVIAWLAYVLIGVKLYWGKLVLIGAAAGSSVALLRPYIGNFLLVVMLYAVLLVSLLSLFKLAAVWKLAVSVAFALPIYLLTEFINITVLDIFIDPYIFQENIYLKFICFLPQLAAMIIISLLLTKYKITIFIDEYKEV